MILVIFIKAFLFLQDPTKHADTTCVVAWKYKLFWVVCGCLLWNLRFSVLNQVSFSGNSLRSIELHLKDQMKTSWQIL